LTTFAATGVLRLSWLLIAFPLFGAAVLLLGGRRTDRWGHLLGVVMPVASFVYAVIAFFTLLGAGHRSQDQHLFSYIPVAGLQVNMGLLTDQLSISFVLLITGVGSLIHIYSVGYMEHDSDRRRFFGYLNLFVAAMLLLVLAVDVAQERRKLAKQRNCYRAIAEEGARFAAGQNLTLD